MFINHIPIAYSVWLIVYKFLQRIYNYYVSDSFIKIDKSLLTARSSCRYLKKNLFSLNLQVDLSTEPPGKTMKSITCVEITWI